MHEPRSLRYHLRLLPVAAVLFFGYAWLSGLDTRIGPVRAAREPAAQAVSQSTDLPSPNLELKGHLVPTQWVEVGTTYGGRVEQVFVTEGDQVLVGQPLAQVGDPVPLKARIAAAELKLLAAQQALEDLHAQVKSDLARTNLEIARADKERALAESRLRSLRKLPEAIAVQQAYANMLLAARRIDKRKTDLRKAEKLWNDKASFLWRFIRHSDYRLMLLDLQRQVAQAEVAYQAAIKAYNEKQKPADPVDLSITEAQLVVAQARLENLRQTRKKLLSGPDPDQVEGLQARIQSAASELQAAQAAHTAMTLLSPLSGKVVSASLAAGEWSPPGGTLFVIADISGWSVECNELTEEQILLFQPGAPVNLTIDALPDFSQTAMVESLGSTYTLVHGDVRFNALIDLPAAAQGLRWGMTVRIRLEN